MAAVGGSAGRHLVSSCGAYRSSRFEAEAFVAAPGGGVLEDEDVFFAFLRGGAFCVAGLPAAAGCVLCGDACAVRAALSCNARFRCTWSRSRSRADIAPSTTVVATTTTAPFAPLLIPEPVTFCAAAVTESLLVETGCTAVGGMAPRPVSDPHLSEQRSPTKNRSVCAVRRARVGALFQ